MRGALLLYGCLAFGTTGLYGQAVGVRHEEGLVRGFLTLSATDGRRLATGDLLQTSAGNRVTSRVIFHFRDGSLYDDTATFTQGRVFQLVSDHLIEKGPAFPRPIDMTIDRAKGRVVVRYMDDGKAKVADEQMDLPANLANGMVPILLKNVRSADLPLTLSMVAATPKPRLVKLRVTAAGEEPFTTAGRERRAVHYVIKAEIGGLAGVIAPLVGKQPPDSHVWILSGSVPAFVKSESPFFPDAPLWRIELASPDF
jgi:hypothetical protein